MNSDEEDLLQRARARSLTWRWAVRGIEASAEACMPEVGEPVPGWRQTDIPGRTVAYLDLLPQSQRRQLMALFVFFELSPILFCWGFRPLSRHRPERRLRYIQSWRHSRWTLRKLIGDALKAVLTMIYLSHPKALAFVGHSKACAHESDKLRVAYKAEALTRVDG